MGLCMGYRCLCEGLWSVVLYGGEASRSSMLRCIIIMYVGGTLDWNVSSIGRYFPDLVGRGLFCWVSPILLTLSLLVVPADAATAVSNAGGSSLFEDLWMLINFRVN